MNAYWNQYQQNQVNTASPEQVLVMLYDGAIRFTVQALQGIAENDRVKKAEAISRAMGIITTLSDTLDHDIGGEIAENLDALYNFMVQELTKANLNSDPAHLKTVEGLLHDLRSAWVEAIDIYRQGQQTAQGAQIDSSHQGSRLQASSV